MKYVTVQLVVVALTGLTAWDAAALPTIQVEPPDKLTRDAAYVGAMAFAGLALFGSTLITRVHGLTTKKRRGAAFLVFLGSFSLVAVQLGFAARMGGEDPEPLVW